MTGRRSARVAWAIALAVVSSLPGGTRGALPPDPRSPHPAVCRVVVPERDGTAFGSGTLIDARGEYGLVVSNWHVVRDAVGKIEVIFPDGFRSEARPTKLDEAWDLAALVVWRPPTEPAPLAAEAPRPGEPLVICGYGSGEYRAAAGRCTDYFAPRVGMPEELVELDVEARQGDSGGPIFNSRGELAGVLFGAGRGTTLGSFGGRVRVFLASVAPGIGRPDVGGIAVASPRGPRGASDPFLAADRAAEWVVERGGGRDSLAAAAAFPTASTSGAPPPGLAPAEPLELLEPVPRSAAPRADAVAGGPRDHTAPYDALPTSGKRPAVEAPSPEPDARTLLEARGVVGGFGPSRPVLAPSTSASPGAKPVAASPSAGADPRAAATAQQAAQQGAIEWAEEGRTLLAVFGLAAVTLHALRAIG